MNLLLILEGERFIFSRKKNQLDLLFFLVSFFTSIEVAKLFHFHQEKTFVNIYCPLFFGGSGGIKGEITGITTLNEKHGRTYVSATVFFFLSFFYRLHLTWAQTCYEPMTTFFTVLILRPFPTAQQCFLMLKSSGFRSRFSISTPSSRLAQLITV